VKASILSLTIGAASLAMLALDPAGRSAAAEDLSFAGKTITMTIGFAAGSGTDLYGRLIGQRLASYLPGNPRLIVMNQPGAGGVVALNDWSRTADPNGQFLTIGQQSQADPDSLARANAKYDPQTFDYVGGVASASQGLIIDKAAVKRLTDRTANPVTMGVVGSTLRGGNYQALWGSTFLGWNVKWVRGYESTGDVRQAMVRGEIDMSSFSAYNDWHYLNAGGKFSVISQAGAWVDGKLVKSAWLADAPFIAELIELKTKGDPQAQRAFDYWQNLTQIGIWLALPPDTPDPITVAYGKAYNAAIQDPTFRDEYAKINPDALFVSGADVSKLVSKVTNVSPQTLRYIDHLLQHQGFVSAQ
jgi:tripartite-type tricarboxylate transporter receptor subunit TctC